MRVLALRESVPNVTAIVAGSQAIVMVAIVVVAVQVAVGVVVIGRKLTRTARRLDESKRGVDAGFIVVVVIIAITAIIVIGIVFARTATESPPEV